MDMNEKVLRYLKDPVVVGIAAFSVGATVGFLIGRRRHKEEYIHAVPAQDWSAPRTEDGEIDFDAIKREMGITDDPDVVEEGESFVKERIVGRDVAASGTEVIFTQEVDEDEEQPEWVDHPELIREPLFAGMQDDWDYDTELKNRSSDVPYVIHKDEFWNEEMGFTQTTLTYYAGDNIMADQDDKPIYNHEAVVGPLKFGHGSGDENVFHVRNEKLKAEYEILHDRGLFSVEVLGLEIENNARAVDVRHSGNRKSRQED